MKWIKAVELRERGLKYREIAEELGTSTAVVGSSLQYYRMDHEERRAWHRRNGERRASITPKPKRGPWSADEVFRLRVYVNELTYEQIAKKLNRTVNAVAGQCHRLGLKKSA